MALVSLLLFLHLASVYATTKESFEECSTKRDVLLRALYQTGNNLDELNRVFYPAEQLPAKFITVNYYFNNTGIGNCTVSYYWATGGFLLIQPPSIFQFSSLFFWFSDNPTDDSQVITLTLPEECKELISVEDGNCSCNPNHTTLERLTQQVRRFYLVQGGMVKLFPC